MENINMPLQQKKTHIHAPAHRHAESLLLAGMDDRNL